MPNYDYECLECGKRFEVFQSMNDAKLTDCPKTDCEGKVKRLLGTGGGIIFKGSGFYQTDYRSSSYDKGAKADKPPEKSEVKSESESKSKSESKKVDSPAPAKPATP
jgi:putative FmdB family regulatory protein